MRKETMRFRSGFGSVEDFFHRHHVDETSVETSLLPEDPDFSKTTLVIERLSCSIEGKREEHDLVESVRAGSSLELFEKHASHAGPSGGALHVHRQIRDTVVRAAMRIGVERGPSQDPRAALGDDEFVARFSPLQSLAHFGLILWRGLERSLTVLDALVVDARDVGKVRRYGGPHANRVVIHGRRLSPKRPQCLRAR